MTKFVKAWRRFQTVNRKASPNEIGVPERAGKSKCYTTQKAYQAESWQSATTGRLVTSRRKKKKAGQGECILSRDID